MRGKSGDGGIDGVGVLRVNLVSFQVYFQCKRWKGSVGSKEIRDFRGALQGRADKGLFITTGHFTSQASDEATRDGAIAIDLIDGDRLCELLKENRLGVATEMIEQISIQPDWFLGIYSRGRTGLFRTWLRAGPRNSAQQMAPWPGCWRHGSRAPQALCQCPSPR